VATALTATAQSPKGKKKHKAMHYHGVGGGGVWVCIDENELSHQSRVASACLAPAGIGTEAMVEAREDVDVQEVVVLCERREGQSEAVGRLVCMLIN